VLSVTYAFSVELCFEGVGFMPKRREVTNKVLFGGILLSLFVSQMGFAKVIENDDAGYLSNRPYNLSNGNSVTGNSRIQILDPDEPEKVFGLNFSFSTRGTDVNDDNVQGKITASYVGVEFAWNVTNWIRADFIGGYQFAMGNSALIYGIEGTPYTGPSFDEASFTATAIPQTEISAGIVSTEFNPISSTFGGTGFAGLREVYNFENGSFFGSLKGFQVAPSSLGVANRAVDSEKNPFLTIGNINLGFKTERFKAMLGYTKYDFYGMTSASASDSRYLGNSVKGIEVVNYEYKFRGQELAATSILTLRLDDKLGVSGNVTKNDEAPDKRNFGWMAKGYYEYNFKRYSVRPSITRFRFEPDLMPAFFSRGGLGFLNRDGYAGEIRGTLKKYKLDGYVSYLDAKEVERKAEQSDRISVTVGLEVKYEIL
jgi:hypothetical protein